jgi:hypothetical protein
VTKQGRNDVSSARIRRVTVAAYWNAVDMLPRSVRHAMFEAVTDWDATQVYQGLVKAMRIMPPAEAIRLCVQWLRESDSEERRRFADAFEAKHKLPYPARAAQSTVQRYNGRRSRAA